MVTPIFNYIKWTFEAHLKSGLIFGGLKNFGRFLVTTEEGCQARKWLCRRVFVIKNTFIESSGCNLLFIFKIFDVRVVLM